MSAPFFTTLPRTGRTRSPASLSRGGAGVGARVPNLMLMLAQAPQLHFPLTHRFRECEYQGRTVSLYIREIRFPAGALVISKLHRTRHPWVMSAGRMSVWTEFDGVRIVSAPLRGITVPGTRRIA